jgi:hypothetical protein
VRSDGPTEVLRDDKITITKIRLTGVILEHNIPCGSKLKGGMPVSKKLVMFLFSIVLVIQSTAPGAGVALARGGMNPCTAGCAMPCCARPCEGMAKCGTSGPQTSCGLACALAQSQSAYLASSAFTPLAHAAAALAPIPGVLLFSSPLPLGRAAEEVSRGRPTIYLSDHSLLI